MQSLEGRTLPRESWHGEDAVSAIPHRASLLKASIQDREVVPEN